MIAKATLQRNCIHLWKSVQHFRLSQNVNPLVDTSVQNDHFRFNGHFQQTCTLDADYAPTGHLGWVCFSCNTLSGQNNFTSKRNRPTIKKSNNVHAWEMHGNILQFLAFVHLCINCGSTRVKAKKVQLKHIFHQARCHDDSGPQWGYHNWPFSQINENGGGLVRMLYIHNDCARHYLNNKGRDIWTFNSIT